MLETSAVPCAEGLRLCPGCSAADRLIDGEPTFTAGWACPSCGSVIAARDDVVMTSPLLADTVSGFDPEDFDFLAMAEDTHFWFVARRELIVRLVDAYAPQAQSFLEIGCGSGNVVNALAQRRRWDRIVGAEIHTKGLAHARRRMAAGVELIQVDARKLPYRSAFDLAGAFDVLEHIEEDEAVMRQIHATLRPGGMFIATVPQHPYLWGAADVVAHHVRRYRRWELEEKLSRAGFAIRFSTSFTVSLLPLMIASRLLAGRVEIDPQAARDVARREFNVSPTINRALTAILRAEIALTARGARWPAGGSRVVVAERM